MIRAAAGTALPFTGAEMLSSFPVKKRDGSTVQVLASIVPARRATRVDPVKVLRS